jgi:hypothetical protein
MFNGFINIPIGSISAGSNYNEGYKTNPRINAGWLVKLRSVDVYCLTEV